MQKGAGIASLNPVCEELGSLHAGDRACAAQSRQAGFRLAQRQADDSGVGAADSDDERADPALAGPAGDVIGNDPGSVRRLNFTRADAGG